MTRTHPVVISSTDASPPAGSALSVSSAGAYRRDWRLFDDWCTATGRQALPASADTVEAFLRAAGGAPSSVRRYRATIANAHHHAGHKPPENPASVPPHPFPGVGTDAMLSRIPVWGWPAGLFGRRDAMLLVVRVQAGLTLNQTAGLTVEQIHLDDERTLHLTGVQLPSTKNPLTCPACVWLRWRTMLTHFARFTPAAVLARHLHRRDITIEHRCARKASDPRGGRQPSGPVLVPINQWGATPIPLLPTSTRTVTTLTGAHTRGVPPRRAPRIPPPAEQPATPAAPVPSVIKQQPIDGRTPAQVHALGLAARQRDHHALKQVTANFDQLDAATAQLQARLEGLLGAVSDDLTRPHEIRQRKAATS